MATRPEQPPSARALSSRLEPSSVRHLRPEALSRGRDQAVKIYPSSARRLRFEAFKIAMFRSSQLLSQYIGKRGSQLVGGALSNLGQDVPEEFREVHTYFHAINGGAKLRGASPLTIRC